MFPIISLSYPSNIACLTSESLSLRPMGVPLRIQESQISATSTDTVEK